MNLAFLQSEADYSSVKVISSSPITKDLTLTIPRTREEQAFNHFPYLKFKLLWIRWIICVKTVPWNDQLFSEFYLCQNKVKPFLGYVDETLNSIFVNDNYDSNNPTKLSRITLLNISTNEPAMKFIKNANLHKSLICSNAQHSPL